MKKYFMKGTDDEVQFGDMIELDLTKDMENGHVQHHHLECKFVPDLVPLLLEDGIIDVVEDEEEEEGNENLEFTDDCPVLKDVIKTNEALELKVDSLEKTVAKLEEKLRSLQKTLKKLVA